MDRKGDELKDQKHGNDSFPGGDFSGQAGRPAGRSPGVWFIRLESSGPPNRPPWIPGSDSITQILSILTSFIAISDGAGSSGPGAFDDIKRPVLPGFLLSPSALDLAVELDQVVDIGRWVE